MDGDRGARRPLAVMKIYFLIVILAILLLPQHGRAEEGASGHYIPGVTADFSSVLQD